GRVTAAPYRELLAEVARTGTRIALDSSGPLFAELVRSGVAIRLVKPNTHELAEFVGRPLTTRADVVIAARELIASGGVSSVMVTLGADGALLVTETDVTFAAASPPTVRNTAGAGDSALAGFLSGTLQDASQPLRRAVEWGAIAVATEGTLLVDLDVPLTDVVHEEHPDLSRALVEPALVG
ncbi:MAG: PfkB family carbohydrate kinase, partial [Microbacterium sp.]